MTARTIRFAWAAAVILVMLGGLSLWPCGNSGNDQWWLAPPAAWGRELLATLATVQAVTCREQTVFVAADGSQDASSTWDVFYMSKDSYRRDIYDGQILREIQWYVPDGNDMIQYGIRYDQRNYGAVRHKGSFGTEDPVARIRLLVGKLDKADRFLGESVLEGHACIGFEIHADKYGAYPETRVARIWFDVRTKLPVRVEDADQAVTGIMSRTSTTIMDLFVYDAHLPVDTFLPQPPPEGFVNAHPDDLPHR